MEVTEKALEMLRKHALCDHCLGRQFALLGYGIENDTRGKALKLSLAMEASAIFGFSRSEGAKRLRILAINGFSKEASNTLKHLNKPIPKKKPSYCFLCEGKLLSLDHFVQRALSLLEDYEHTTFLVGIELPLSIEEREDEFKANFNISHGENIRHEFGRLLGKYISESTHKEVEYRKPDLAVIINPFEDQIRLQINPLFVAGRYRKLVRDIPQSKWFCSNCKGKGCEKCAGTGKMYPESVEELVSTSFLDAADAEKTSFHASGREDIDARMLGRGRPFVIEISTPKKRFLILEEVQTSINEQAKGKVEVSNLRFSEKDAVRRLKKAEKAQKHYRVLIEFEKAITQDNLSFLEENLQGTIVRQQTPLRVLHRRADLVREKYIYEVKVKKVSLKRAELEIRCQGGLYIKELVSGDEGRTIPSVSELLGNRAKPLKLDVLNVYYE